MFKKSSDAGKKLTSGKGNILISVTDMDNDTILATQMIAKKDLDEPITVGGVTIAHEAPAIAKEPSKVKEVAYDIANGFVVTGKAIVIKTDHGIKGLSNFFKGIKEGLKENAVEYDSKRVEKAAKVVNDHATQA